MNEALRTAWYQREDVLSNIVPLIKEREVCFLVPFSVAEGMRKQGIGVYPIRCIKAHHSSYLGRNMTAFDFMRRPYNLYHSIFLLQDMPLFSFNPMARKEAQDAFFLKYYDYVKGLDFVMDFDGDKTLPLMERIESARISTLLVTAILDQFHVPYNVVFSGSKGFHIEVRGFPPTRNWKTRVKVFEQFALRLIFAAYGERNKTSTLSEDELREELKRRFSFDSSIYTVTRIWKCPFSYDVSTDMIAYPLNADELGGFDPRQYTAENLLKANHWGVGLKRRPGSIENFWTLAADLGVTEHEDDNERPRVQGILSGGEK